MIARFYFWLLWNLGFKDKDNDLDTPEDREKITFMLRRQVQRLKWLWYVLSLGTICLFIVWGCVLVYRHSWWFVLPTCLWLFSSWLFIHVLYTAKFPPEARR